MHHHAYDVHGRRSLARAANVRLTRGDFHAGQQRRPLETPLRELHWAVGNRSAARILNGTPSDRHRGLPIALTGREQTVQRMLLKQVLKGKASGGLTEVGRPDDLADATPATLWVNMQPETEKDSHSTVWFTYSAR